MKKYQYKLEDIPADISLPDYVLWLNKHGEEGWQYVSEEYSGDTEGLDQVLFMREING